MLHLSRIVIVFVALFSSACSGAIDTPTSPSSATGSTALTVSQVSGSWKLTYLQEADQPGQPAPAGASYGLTFADGRASVRADCNVCGGAVTASDQSIVIGPALACTRAACPTMAFETLYERLLSGESQPTVSGSVLTLSSPRGTLIFNR